MEDDQKEDSPVYPCDECDKIFSKSQHLAGHKAYTHHIEVSICEFCSNEFKNKEKLRQHINSVHTDANYICDMCSKVFKNNSLLYGHKKIVHEEAEAMCSNCGIIMMNPYKLQKHLKRCLKKGYEDLKDDKPSEDDLTCSECNKTFGSLKSFKQHTKTVHTYNPVTCQLCRMDFKNITCFRQHLIRAHEIVDPNRILALIKDVKPDYEEVSRKKKVNQSNINNDQNSSNLSEYQKQRNNLLNKWKEIEKEQNEKASLLKVELSASFHDDCKLPQEETKMNDEDIKMNKELLNDIKMNKDLLDAFDINFHEKEQNERNDAVEATLKSKEQPEGWNFMTEKSDQDNNSEEDLHVKIEANDDVQTSSVPKDNLDTLDKLQVLNEKKEDESDEEDLKVKTEPNDEQETEERQVLNEWKVNESAVNECSQCGKSFSQEKYLISHINTAHKYEPCDCPFCDGKTFKNKLYLSQHLKRMHQDQNYKLPKKQRAKIPRAKTAKIKEGPFICDLCGKQFKDAGKLRQHNRTHSDEKQQCPYCPTLCKHLSSHIANSHNKVECVCNQCGKTCMSKVALRNHVATVHPSEGHRRICSLCGKQFKNSASLRQHQRKTFGCSQTDSTSFVNCPECGKEFINKHALYNHRYHTHVFENVDCPNCGRAFKSKVALSKHIKRTCSSPINSRRDLVCY